MANSSFDNQTAEKILKARALAGKPYAEKMVTEKNFYEIFKRSALKDPQKVYLTYRYNNENIREDITWQQMFETCAQLANFMVEKLGIKAGDRVVSFAYNHPKTVQLAFACWMVGATYAPLNAGDDDDRIQFVLKNSEAKAIFVMPEFIERYKAIDSGLIPHMVELAEIESLIKDQSTDFNGDNLARHDTEALLVYTSGTTGEPKGVILQQYNLLVEGKSITEWYGFDENTRMMLILPIHHVNGLILTLLTPVWFGGSVVLNHKFSASTYWQTVEEEKCTVGSVVPTILSFLLEVNEDVSARNLGGYFIICGAGPLTVELGKRFEETFNVMVNHGYGLSETVVYSCYLPFDLTSEERKKWMRDYGYPSIGVPIACNEMDIQDEEGRTVAEGEKGEIVIRGHNVMQCYFKRPESNADTFMHNWFRSGDEGFYKTDDQGRKFFFITGRLKELIIRGGVNYSPLEIDEVINRIEGVKAGMAVGFENDFYGEEIGAYVKKEAESSLTQEDVIAACASLPFAKRPKVVIFGDDFPVTATGKYQRNKLKHLFAEHKSKQFAKPAS
jgi:long-chain acyl-CoA synthetase